MTGKGTTHPFVEVERQTGRQRYNWSRVETALLCQNDTHIKMDIN